jgi:hypothetical protein
MLTKQLREMERQADVIEQAKQINVLSILQSERDSIKNRFDLYHDKYCYADGKTERKAKLHYAKLKTEAASQLHILDKLIRKIKK